VRATSEVVEGPSSGRSEPSDSAAHHVFEICLLRHTQESMRVLHRAVSMDRSDHGTQTVEEGAEVLVRMVQISTDGPTGRHQNVAGPMHW
jgi:hypothetical protein